MAALRTRHVIPALVALGESLLDPGLVFQQRRTAEHDFPIPERFGAFDAERDLVTFGTGFGGISVDLIEQHNARADAPETRRAIGCRRSHRGAIAETCA